MFAGDTKYKENIKKKVQFVEYVKQHSEICMMHTIYGLTFYLITKKRWIGDPSSLCHITNNDNILFDIINIDKSIHGSFGIILKKGKV